MKNILKAQKQGIEYHQFEDSSISYYLSIKTNNIALSILFLSDFLLCTETTLTKYGEELGILKVKNLPCDKGDEITNFIVEKDLIIFFEKILESRCKKKTKEKASFMLKKIESKTLLEILEGLAKEETQEKTRLKNFDWKSLVGKTITYFEEKGVVTSAMKNHWNDWIVLVLFPRNSYSSSVVLDYIEIEEDKNVKL